MKAHDLLLARAEINSFLVVGCNSPGSMITEPMDEDVQKGYKKSRTVKVTVLDMNYYDSTEEQDCDYVFSVCLPKNIVRRALEHEAGFIEGELLQMGVDLTQEFRPSSDAAPASDTQTAATSDTSQNGSEDNGKE